ncbi:unnamed protein product [Rhizoctonia solani]|uniref:Terpene synthase n=1 Tax=Rhizoctonia solani TaxID=456999 RepID=A0A8H3GE66_9AGAM|nr:unnamed protein product [Rhizoctonia solani]
MADIGELDFAGLKSAVEITMNALRNPDALTPELKIVATLQSFANRMRANGGSRAIQHFIEALDDYRRAIIKENVKMARNHVETIEEYIEARWDTSVVKQTFAMLEYAHCLDLPDEVFLNPIVAELATAGGEILAWTNDIYSFPAEDSNGQLHNFVYVVSICNMQSIMSMSESKHAWMNNQVAQYVQGIEYVVQGCIEWYFITPRYLGANVRAAKETGVVKLKVPVSTGEVIIT